MFPQGPLLRVGSGLTAVMADAYGLVVQPILVCHGILLGVHVAEVGCYVFWWLVDCVEGADGAIVVGFMFVA